MKLALAYLQRFMEDVSNSQSFVERVAAADALTVVYYRFEIQSPTVKRP